MIHGRRQLRFGLNLHRVLRPPRLPRTSHLAWERVSTSLYMARTFGLGRTFVVMQAGRRWYIESTDGERLGTAETLGEAAKQTNALAMPAGAEAFK